ncbi:GlpM family protein [Vibrio vulnificus]|nr:GlpM family protein [Vibrio vulnificus]HAS8567073.1 GlpM family protein [Vibrio vulnificus]
MRLIFYDLTNQDQKGKASVISLFLKSLLGAAAVVIIALLSKSKNFYIAGLVPLFPTFALIAHFIVGTERSMEDLRQTALFGLWSLLPYAAYLAAVYYFSYRFSLVTTLSAATVIWLMAASLLIVAWTKVMISV